ncbi:IS200/IS605 family transposase [Chryseobacterium fluminis]|uniref:IS200/IS605 family transposase n=1 Tax=Chryseobacterium fluminis TaxID=2983606 RepID=UPI00225638AA|nr:IS200/IS605 family transposase [Chryseobacterium sp. MMS21-Ot14]UZT97859.1 IS200/IS605 family transposase [Chryseobacterium sp. MMS21-Ot14]
MGTYRQIFYHIVFATKYRKPTINEKNESELYKYIWGILKNKNCKLYRINGMPDHIHILCDLHPSITLSNLVKDIKVATNLWMKESGLFTEFIGWQEGYGAFTCSVRDKEKVINYIKNQKEHHRKETFENEFKNILAEHAIKPE